MKRIVKRVLLVAAIVGGVGLVGGAAFAEGGFGHGPRGHHGKMFEKLESMDEQERLEFLEEKLDKRVAKMTKKLDLTDAQAKQVRQILADSQTQLLEVWERNKGDREAMRAEAGPIFKASRTAIEGVLTDAQKAKVKEHMGKKMRRGKKHLALMLEDRLDLDDQQVKQVNVILDDAFKQVKGLAENADSRDDAREQGRAVFLAAADKIEAVLDADQKAEFAEMKQRFVERAGKRGKHGRKHGKKSQK